MPATIDLFINLSAPARRALVQSYDSLSNASAPDFVVRDTVRIRLHFMTVASGARVGTTFDLGGSATINFGAKVSAFASATSYLFYSSGFTRDASDPDDVVFEADVDLNTSELVTALGSSASVNIKIEVEVDDGSTLQTVAQADAFAVNDVIDGTSSSPTSSTPPYPAAPAADSFLTGNAAGTAWSLRNPAAVKTLLGLSTTDTPVFDGVSVTDVAASNAVNIGPREINDFPGGGTGSLNLPPLGGVLVAATSVPATATSTGSAGMIAYDNSYLYICVATNTWRRVAIASW